jgi:hypothetical protein
MERRPDGPLKNRMHRAIVGVLLAWERTLEPYLGQPSQAQEKRPSNDFFIAMTTYSTNN